MTYLKTISSKGRSNTIHKNSGEKELVKGSCKVLGKLPNFPLAHPDQDISRHSSRLVYRIPSNRAKLSCLRGETWTAVANPAESQHQ